MRSIAIRRISVGVGVAGFCAALSGCGGDEAGALNGGGGEGGRVTQASEARGAKARMPSELRAAYIAAAQRGAPESYRARASAGGLVADNAAHDLVTGFGPEGVAITARRGDAARRVTLATARFGCEGALAPVAAAELIEGEGRVELRRAGSSPLVEWYVNGPLGLEQGFTIAAPPCASPERLDVEVRIDGDLAPALAGDGEVELRDPSGAAALRLTDLYAHDATGRALPASFAIVDRGGALAIRVEAAGAAYPIVIDPLLATPQAKLLAGDGAAGDQFGAAVAVAGDTALISARFDDDKATDDGSAYVFVRSGVTWSLQQKLTASDGETGDRFGAAVALVGDTALVGAIGDDDKGSSAGAAYVFVRSGVTWTQQQKLVASDGDAGDFFGRELALSGDTALVGAYQDDDKGANSGSAYVFTRSGVTWTQQQKLVPADGAAGDRFGVAVAVADDTALIGADSDDDKGANAGSAYVFTRSGVTWSQQTKLLAIDGAADDNFGSAVALVGDTALVGAIGDDDKGLESGSAYVFVRSGVTWSQQQKLVPADGAAGDFFGNRVALAGDTALVGAFNDDDKGANAGSAYVFARSGVTWTQQTKLLAADGAADDLFGYAVAISGNTIVVGAYDDDDKGLDSGSAHVFLLANSDKANGAACASANECASGFCADGVCCATACNAGPCDACSIAAGASVDGTCKPLSGALCNDGNGCTQTDTCQSGVCVGGAPVVCGAAGSCFTAGSCDPATGKCSSPAKPDGTPCNDGNACTLNDACQGGACVGASAVVCAPLNACHGAGACDPATGQCSKPTLPDGVPCSDGDACTLGDACVGGVCVAGASVTCPASDACHAPGTCNPATGACSNPTKADGAACDDGDGCTESDACQAGVCAGKAIVCVAPDACHEAGSCVAELGACSFQAKADGTACDDGDACTANDTCKAGACAPGAAVSCAPIDECHEAGACSPATGQCSHPVKADGAACSMGVCTDGVCGPPGSGTGGGGGSAATGGATGGGDASGGAGGGLETTTGAGQFQLKDPPGCGCELVGAGGARTSPGALALPLLLALRRRRAGSRRPGANRRGWVLG